MREQLLGYVVGGKNVPYNTPLAVTLPIGDWLRIQTFVVAMEVQMKREPSSSQEFLKSMADTRKRLAQSIKKARGLD
jgi:hypothetical protein